MGGMTRRELLAAIPVVGIAMKARAKSTGPTELWELRMQLYVPRIYDNMQSKGYRKYQRQRITGYLEVTPDGMSEPVVQITGLENVTHKVNGRRVTYDVPACDHVVWHAIGNNRTGVFNTRSVRIDFEAMPSYAIGPEPNEDNSLLVTLAGRGYGNGGSRIRGYAAGQIGCGCYEYGHVSPTRIWGQTRVVDTASVFGTWSAKRVR